MGVDTNPDGCCGASGQCPTSPGPASLQVEIPELGCSFSIGRISSNFWGLGSGCSLCGNVIGVSVACSGEGNWSLSITPANPSCAAVTTRFTVAASNPVYIEFEMTLPDSCCQTGTLRGTVTE